MEETRGTRVFRELACATRESDGIGGNRRIEGRIDGWLKSVGVFAAGCRRVDGEGCKGRREGASAHT